MLQLGEFPRLPGPRLYRSEQYQSGLKPFDYQAGVLALGYAASHMCIHTHLRAHAHTHAHRNATHKTVWQ